MNRVIGLLQVLQRVAALLLLSALAALAMAAHSAGVAMVTDLKGKATASSAGSSSDVTILAELAANTKVELEAGATLVVLYLDAGDEYVFKGPATIEFKPVRPDVQRGEKPERRRLTLGKGGKNIRIKPVGITQGAIVMRGVRTDTRVQFLSLDRTRTLDFPLEFRWQELRPGVRYEFELADETGRVVFASDVDATSFTLPASVRVKEGVPYTWQVSGRLPDGWRFSNATEFELAPADLRAQAEALRPGPSAPLSTRIAYAAWLEQMELKDEARKYWKAAAAERPADPRLKVLAGT
jgi:hypothetical protein